MVTGMGYESSQAVALILDIGLRSRTQRLWLFFLGDQKARCIC